MYLIKKARNNLLVRNRVFGVEDVGKLPIDLFLRWREFSSGGIESKQGGKRWKIDYWGAGLGGGEG